MNSTIRAIFDQLGCGKLQLTPYVVMKDGTRIYPQYKFHHNVTSQNFSLIANDEHGFSDSLYFQYQNGEILCRRLFENTSKDTLTVKELAVALSGITFDRNPDEDFFYHNENPRMFCRMTFPIDFDRTQFELNESNFDKTTYQSLNGNCWADPGVYFSRIGDCPYQPFPAILISNYGTTKGLVHGTLRQNPFYHNYFLAHNDGTVTMEIYSSFKAIDARVIEPGSILQDEWYMGATDDADNIEKIFEKYTAVLRKKLPVGYGRTSINRDNLVWGSWNDGILRNVTEDLLVREAAFLKENFPTVRWIQLDDGYAAYAGEHGIAHGLGMPYEGDEGLDQAKFPNGLKAYADKIREIGLRPALWVGGFCPVGTKIYKEHPDWFFDYSVRTDDTAPLDVSKEEVRAYMTHALDVLLAQPGFEGIKHDFWSYAFEDSNDYLANKNKSGYEYRNWWLKEIRNRLPADGYMQTGCDIVMGNPFLGEFFTNYRYGDDIGAGDWGCVWRTYMWGMACFALHIGDLIVPNSDSIGMLPGLNDTEAQFFFNYCLATRSTVEISGLLSQAEQNDRFKMLKKAACNPNNGQDVYFANYDYRTKGFQAEGTTPEILYFKTPHFSVIENGANVPLRTVALFNIYENKKSIDFTAEDLGLETGDYLLTDVWSGEQYPLHDKAEFTVEPHASRLFAVSKCDGIQLYDANIRINAVTACGNALLIQNDYPARDTELYFSRNVQRLFINGREIPFTSNGTTITFHLDAIGEIKAEF